MPSEAFRNFQLGFNSDAEGGCILCRHPGISRRSILVDEVEAVEGKSLRVHGDAQSWLFGDFEQPAHFDNVVSSGHHANDSFSGFPRAANR